MCSRVRNVAATAALLTLACGAPRAEEATETVTVRQLPPDTGHRLYLPDIAFSHIVDGHLHIVDGDAMTYLGVVSLGFTGQMAIAPDRKTIYTATTYYSRLDHGTRTDVVAGYDGRTLERLFEVTIPPKHAQAVPYAPYMATSHDGQMLFVQNATPASSVTVFDVAARKVLAEVQTAGCFGIYPSDAVAGRFSTLCGDGAAVTIAVDATGQEVARARSEKLFDAEQDPLFIQGTRGADGKTLFVTFGGEVHEVDMNGTKAVQGAPWRFGGSTEAEKGWVPGGYQVVASHLPTHQLFVAMHGKGTEGSHKNPADEIWGVDLASHAVTFRVPSDGAVALSAAMDPAPVLFALKGADGSLTKYEVDKGLKKVASMPTVAEAATTLAIQ